MSFEIPKTVKFIRTCEQAKLPTKGSLGASGFDLYSAYEYFIYPGSRCLVDTGLRVCIPEGHEAQVRPRSGLALDDGITVLNSPGTIDADYNGKLGVVLINTDLHEPFHVRVGYRVAQLVFAPVFSYKLLEVEDDSEFEDSIRGQGGFGSTGK